MPQIQGGNGEVTPWRDFASSTDLICRKPLTTQEMGYRRFSHRVNKMAAFDRFQDVAWSDFQWRMSKNA